MRPGRFEENGDLSNVIFPPCAEARSDFASLDRHPKLQKWSEDEQSTDTICNFNGPLIAQPTPACQVFSANAYIVIFHVFRGRNGGSYQESLKPPAKHAFSMACSFRRDHETFRTACKVPTFVKRCRQREACSPGAGLQALAVAS